MRINELIYTFVVVILSNGISGRFIDPTVGLATAMTGTAVFAGKSAR